MSMLRSLRAPDAVALAALAAGFVLRFWQLGDAQVFGDEIHSLHHASRKSFAWIATHFARNDACIPYTLYNKLFLETVGLSEWLMRLPAAAAGVAVTLTAWICARRIGSAWSAAFVAAALSLSPYLVYLSREARPYAIVMWLVTWAGCLLLGAAGRGADTRRLPLAALLLAIAVFFHPVVAPGALVLWSLPLLQARSARDPAGALRRWGIATLVGLVAVAALLGPASGSLIDSLGQKGSKGSAGFDTFESGLVLLHGLRIVIPLWLWLLGGAVALAGFARKLPLEAAVVGASLAVQLAAVQLLQPHLSEVPWVWSRYWVHLLPLVLICLAAGTDSLLAGLALAGSAARSGTARVRSVEVAGALALAALLIGYAAGQFDGRNYALRTGDVHPAHPMAFFIDEDEAARKDAVPALAFYRDFAEQLPPDAIIVESPRTYTFPLAGRYAPIHGRRILSAGMERGFLQRLLERHQGFRFRTVFRPETALPPGPIYWIHHKNVMREIQDWVRFASENDLSARQLAGTEAMFQPRAALDLFGPEDELAAFEPDVPSKLLSENAYVKVFLVDRAERTERAPDS